MKGTNKRYDDLMLSHTHIISTSKLCVQYIIRPTEKEVRSRVSTRIYDYTGRPKADTQPDTKVDTRQSAPFEVGLIFIISLHKFLVERYVKLHKIDQCHLL